MKRGLLLGIAVLLTVAVSTASSGRSTAGPISGRLHAGLGAVSSRNWAGYAAYGTTFTDVKGSWTQPAADCSAVSGRSSAIAAFWVGLDGFSSQTVEQTGTEADCYGTDSPVYSAWYELYPAGVVELDRSAYPVSPGDALSGEVSQDGSGNVTVTLADSTAGWTFTKTLAASGRDAFSSAEWIAEGPTNDLTDFGTVDFTSATASDAGTTDAAIGGWSNDQVVMITHPGPKGADRAAPGDLSSGGSAFSIAWNHR